MRGSYTATWLLQRLILKWFFVHSHCASRFDSSNSWVTFELKHKFHWSSNMSTAASCMRFFSQWTVPDLEQPISNLIVRDISDTKILSTRRARKPKAFHTLVNLDILAHYHCAINCA
jgi:hypothetical protein